MDDLILAHPARIQTVRYHMSWPGPNDPFYLANIEENDARRGYYSVNYVPNLWIDGVENPGFDVAGYEAALQRRLAETSPLTIGATIENAFLAVDVEAVDAIDADLRLMAVLIENEASHGANTYDQVMRRFVGGTQGTSFSITQGETRSFVLDFDVDPGWNAANLRFVVFAQDPATKAVVQATGAPIDFGMPKLSLQSLTVDDAATGDGDARLDQGEAADLVVTLEALVPWGDAQNIEIGLSTDDPDLTVTDATATIPLIVAGENGSSTEDPFSIEVAPGSTPHQAELRLTISANAGAYERAVEMELLVGHPELLLVDDDGGDNIEEAYTSTLDELGLLYDHWDVANAGIPEGDFINLARQVVWFTGEVEQDVFTAAELTFMQETYDAGRGLYLSGLANGAGLAETQLLADIFGAELVGQGGGQVVGGEEGDPIGDGLLMLLDHNPLTCEVVDPVGTGVAMMNYLPGGQGAGVHNSAGTKSSVFTAFDFSVVGAEDRGLFLQRILDWLEESTGVGEGADAPQPLKTASLWNAPNPFNPVTTITFVLQQETPVRLSIYDISGQLVTTLVDETRQAGEHAIQWVGKNQQGASVASGVYLLRLEQEEQEPIDRPMVLLK